MNFQTIIIIVLLFTLAYFAIDKLSLINKNKKIEEPVKKTDFSKSYQKTYLLTKNEYSEYKKLKKYADEHHLLICPKVRLLDLIKPISGKDYASLRARVQSKHVDFVLTDSELHILAILELDDNSHNNEERQERDAFVDEVLQSVGYKVIRTKAVSDETFVTISEILPTSKA